MTNDDKTKKWILLSFVFMFVALLIYGAFSLGLAPKTEKEEGEVITEKQEHDETKSQIKSENSPLRDSNADDIAREKKSIIVYYSLSGTTEKVANYIKEKTKYDIVKLETQKTYPKNDNELMQLEVDNEKANFIYPALKNKNINLTGYDIIYLGFPIWYSDMARPIYTFLDTYDMSGTIIIPFVCSDNYGQGTVVKMISDFEEGAIVLNNPLAITSYNRADYKKAVDSWLTTIDSKLKSGDFE